MHVILSYSRCVKTMWIVSSASAPGVRFLLSIVNNGVIHVGFGGRPGLTNKQSRESVALTLPPEQTGVRSFLFYSVVSWYCYVCCTLKSTNPLQIWPENMDGSSRDVHCMGKAAGEMAVSSALMDPEVIGFPKSEGSFSDGCSPG